MSDQEEQQTEEREVPIEWIVPDSIVSQYATNMIIQHFEHEFILSFFETQPPLIIGIPSKEQLESLKSVKSTCIARIVIAPERMQNFVNALQTNLEKWLSKQRSPEAIKE
jgi:hypothetical protein